MEALLVFLILIAVIFLPPVYLVYFLIRKRVHLSTLIIVILGVAAGLGLNLRHFHDGVLGWPLDVETHDNFVLQCVALTLNTSIIAGPLLVLAEYIEHRIGWHNRKSK